MHALVSSAADENSHTQNLINTYKHICQQKGFFFFFSLIKQSGTFIVLQHNRGRTQPN